MLETFFLNDNIREKLNNIFELVKEGSILHVSFCTINMSLSQFAFVQMLNVVLV